MSTQLSSFQSILEQFETMGSPPAISANAPSSEVRDGPKGKVVHVLDEEREEQLEESPVQDVDEWMKEQEVLYAAKALQNQAPPKRAKIPPPPPKPKVKDIDPDQVVAEEKALKEIGGENWVGKLQMYRQAKPTAGVGMTWLEGCISEPIPRFTCAVVIHESAQPFGNNTIGFSTKIVSFANKKSAKQHAAKKAVDWLIENKYMPNDGSVKFQKVPIPPPQKKVKFPVQPLPLPQPQPQPQIQNKRSSIDDTSTSTSTSPPRTPVPTSYAQRIPGLCYKLGLTVPQYKLDQAIPNSPLWNAYADFQGDPRIIGKVGEVRDVFGKKNAKEEVAKIVFSFLKDIERHRREQFGMSDGEEEEVDKKRKRSIDCLEEATIKSAKV